MLANKELVTKTIALREKKNDFVREFSIRYKKSPIDEWSEFEKYTEKCFQKIYEIPIVDGVKMKFKYTTLVINGRHSNK